MNIAGTQLAFNPYNKACYEIYISGCNQRCKNCQSPQLWDFNNGVEITDNFFKNIVAKQEFYDVISILGGDLLSQDEHEAFWFVLRLRTLFTIKKMWLFTGKDKEEVPSWCFEFFDYIKVGRYDENLKKEGFPASSNQRLLKKGLEY
jgi:anaerobic ribonucleoside-triphosphate reductase activating protein